MGCMIEWVESRTKELEASLRSFLRRTWEGIKSWGEVNNLILGSPSGEGKNKWVGENSWRNHDFGFSRSKEWWKILVEDLHSMGNRVKRKNRHFQMLEKNLSPTEKKGKVQLSIAVNVAGVLLSGRHCPKSSCGWTYGNLVTIPRCGASYHPYVYMRKQKYREFK